MHVWQTTTVHLDRGEWFDGELSTEHSNQRSKTGRFRMQVREIEHHNTRGLLTEYDEIHAVGRRYKADGTLGSVRVSATITEAELPEPVLTALLEMLGVL